MRYVPVALLFSAAHAFSVVHAFAAPASCQQDFQKLSGERQAAIERINNFGKKRPTAEVACSAFNTLSGVEARFIKWMTENKDWCQIPEDFIAQLKGANGATLQARGQVCTAARQQQEGGGPRGAPPPGAGIRLPSGAL
ncbi:MAG: hypothetical protein IOB85_07010 [Methylobacterium sp.]|nr:hypothetical protein [Methylobacterium sp.]MCA3654321.1 hypothetical protein [Methylobacterium sp.]MCA3658115.1 hypothetical protein [Methylobacterium sp.]MCA3659971.1 hypothetical protein [Methylobacterium sp.]MCA3664038.1 hypothetical protein [Methylobacterium sp.]